MEFTIATRSLCNNLPLRMHRIVIIIILMNHLGKFQIIDKKLE